MNTSNRGQVPGPSPNESSALNLLVNAAGDRASDLQQQQQPRGVDTGGGAASLSLQRLNDLQRMRQLAGGGGQGLGGGGGGGEPSLEDQLFLQQHAAGLSGGFGGNTNSMLNQLRDAQNPLFSQMNQQQQLASLLGLGGGGGAGGGGVGSNDLRLAQLRSMQQNQDLMALRGSGGLTGLLGSGGAGGSDGLGGAGGGYPMSGFQQLQRLEEIDRRHRMLQQETSSSMDRGPQGGRDPLDGSSGRECLRITKGGDKDAIEKTPGSVIVPCRARGMPMDHNFKTAYFVIPENVKHGEELICSYFACRNAGIKFRYCSHCKVPVAKRNFRKRHKHGGDIDIPSANTAQNAKKGIPSQITTSASLEEVADADGISSQSADDFAEAGAAPRDPISSDRKTRWASLLSKRPSSKKKEEMSAWISQVMKVSDLENPLNGNAPSEATKEIPAAESEKDGVTKPPTETKEQSDDGDAPKIKSEETEEEEPADESSDAKNKRSSDLLDKSDSQSGGYAEWKKHKKARKVGLPGGIRSEAV